MVSASSTGGGKDGGGDIFKDIYLKMKRSLKILRGSDSMVCGRLDVTL